MVVPLPKTKRYPLEIRLQVNWNGAVYPFGFRLSPAGQYVPSPFPATVQGTGIPDRTAQPAPLPGPQ